uniref:EB domain-containing protein n=1 Tax=Setaria digitata TaxID=48799 RepID=A0A915PN01_9BILA
MRLETGFTTKHRSDRWMTIHRLSGTMPIHLLWLFVFIRQAQFAFTPCNGKSLLGGTCDWNSDCENKGSICLRGHCRCHPHYVEVTDEKGRNPRCKRLPAKVGQLCTKKCREPLFCRSGQCQCVQRGTTTLINGQCVSMSRVGDRCTRHYDCSAPFSACLNSQCVCISGTIQQGSRCIAAPSCPLGGTPGNACIRKANQHLVENFADNADNCPIGQICITIGDSPTGHCCPQVCPLGTLPELNYSCDPTAAIRCPSDTHFCYRISGGGFSQSLCCRRPCNAMAPNALFVNGECMPRGQLNSQCSTNEQCGGSESMICNRGQCECLAGFHPLVDSVTHPLHNPSQKCTRDCESEALSKDTACLKSVELEAHCFTQKQCPANSGCYRQCKCGFKTEKQRCVAIQPPPVTTQKPSIIVPGTVIAPAGDFLSLIGNFFGGTAVQSATAGR